jgi:hypothetical protein
MAGSAETCGGTQYREDGERILIDVANIRRKAERKVRSTQCNRMLRFNIIEGLFNDPNPVTAKHPPPPRLNYLLTILLCPQTQNIFLKWPSNSKRKVKKKYIDGDMIPYRLLKVYRYFERAFCFHLQCRGLPKQVTSRKQTTQIQKQTFY